MGRKRQFDDSEVLRLVEERFWRDGYQATSMHELAAATGVKTGSLFKCFGSKRDLYLLALQRYADEDSPRAHLLKLFDMPLMDALRRLYDEIIARTGPDGSRPCGCLVSNHVSELNAVEDDVSEVSVDLMRSTRKTLRLRLDWAREHGELPADADIDALTAHLFCTLQGLYVLSISTRNIDDMRRARDIALSMLGRHVDANTQNDPAA